MEVGVIGEIPSRRVKNIIDAVQFFAELLMPEDIVDELIIDVEIDETLDIAGHCLSESSVENPRDFYIAINPKISNQSLYQTLAHEMVHVKQYALNETYNRLSMTDDCISYKRVWQGEDWMPSKSIDEYYDSPWETEAYGKEVGLYYKWKNRNKN